MRKYIFATAVVAALFGSAGYAAAQNLDVGPGGARVDPGMRDQQGDAGTRDRRGGAGMRDQRGDTGMRGHRYYEGRSAFDARCKELRRACMHKEELGEEGGGNCRRYRETCGR